MSRNQEDQRRSDARQPLMRVLRAARWGLSAGDARYYGWLVCLHIGPLAIYAWPALPVGLALPPHPERE